MLLQRCITACILISLALGTIFYAPPFLFNTIGCLILGGCALEWTGLIPANTLPYRALFVSVFFGSLLLSRVSFLPYQLLGGISWLTLGLGLFYFPNRQPWGKPLLVAVLGLTLLPLAASSFTAILNAPQGRSLALYMILLVAATDTGGYFIGKQWGHTKLIPWISPGKTMAGTLGGIISALVVSQLAWLYFYPSTTWSFWLLQALCTIIMAIIGDLSISMLKRRVNCKDTGTLLPGHGGLLDRIDSLIAAAPIFYLLLQN